MAERPLIIFPNPQSASLERPQPFPQKKPERPSHNRQGNRIAPQLTQLQSAFESRLVEIQATADGIDPSQVIVIETVGTVHNFATAVKNLDGLSWLGEFEIDELVPDDDFYWTNTAGERTDKDLRGRLFLVFSNHAAMSQMLSLWQRYQADENIVWPNGLTSLRDIFNSLYAIRRWNVQDRLIENGTLEAWQEDLEHLPNDFIRTEIELWFRGAPELRATAQSDIERLVASVGGQVIQRCEIVAIAYHAILIELPRAAVAQIVDDPATELVKCDSIMYFRPTGQITGGDVPLEQELGDGPPRNSAAYPTGEPVIAVLDGLPVENHFLLQDRLSVEDPEDLSPTYQVRDRIHGTGMCSLIVWGDLSENQPPLARTVYVRPITVPTESLHPPFPERMPSDQLSIDLIHRAVRRMFEGEGGESPTAPTVKIINLSIGDEGRPFLQMVSPFARLIDWLSHKYGVLFVISAGNQTTNIAAGVSRADFQQMTEEQRQTLIFGNLFNNARHRRLLSPSESINGISVNALHQDASGENNTGQLFEVFQAPLPSPVSSFGGGYRRSIKPDVVYSGGRVLYDFTVQGDQLECRPIHRPPGHQVATPGAMPGENHKTAFCRGTSNAAALVSRGLGIAHDTLTGLFGEQAVGIDTDIYLAPLLKTLLIHSSKWDLSGERLKDVLSNTVESRNLRQTVSRLLGYGEPNIARMLECTKQRATVLGFGSIREDEGHLFTMPLPPGLGQQKTPRRLTVTLAWLSPIASTNQRYRASRLFFDLEGNRLATARQEADHNAVRRGTVQHEIFDGEDAIAIASGDSIGIKVSCKKDARSVETPILYGLAVSLEVADEIDIDIYDQVRAAIPIRTEIGVRPRSPIE